MMLEEAIGELAVAGNTLPREAMQWCLDHWDEAGPHFIRMLDDYASGTDRDAVAADVLFFAVHLIGDKADTRSFPALCRFLQDGEAADAILGDAITESLRGVLISAYDGDAELLKALVEKPNAEPFVRVAALMAMVYLTYVGRIADAEMHHYLSALRAQLRPDIEEIELGAWALAAAHLGYDDFLPRIETLFRHPDMVSGFVDLRDVQKQFRAMRDAPDKAAEFARDNILPFTDAIGTLSRWYGFSEEARRKAERQAGAGDNDDDLLSWQPQETYINPHRHVGRNDPCPCGSGKKYKKCCLA